MNRLKTALILVAVLGLLAYAFRGPLSMKLMDIALPRMMTANPIAELSDGLHLTLCGAGSPLPESGSSGAGLRAVANPPTWSDFDSSPHWLLPPLRIAS